MGDRKKIEGISQELSLILQGVRGILSNKNLIEMIHSIFSAAKEILEVKFGYVELRKFPSCESELLLFEIEENKDLRPETFLVGEIQDLYQKSYTQNEILYLNEIKSQAKIISIENNTFTIETVLFAPFSFDGEISGMIGVGNKNGGFSDIDIAVSSIFTELMAIALSNTKNLNSIEKISKQMALLLDSTEEAIYGVNNEGECTFVNSSGLKLLGFNEEREIIGQQFRSFIFYFIEDDFISLSNIDYSIIPSHPSEKIYAKDKYVRNKAGNYIPVEYWIHGIEESAEVVGGVITLFDITEKILAEKIDQAKTKTLEARNRKLECLFKLSDILSDFKIREIEIHDDIIKILKKALTYKRDISVRIMIGGNQFIEKNFVLSSFSLKSIIVKFNQCVGFIEVFYNENDYREFYNTLKKDTQNLLDEVSLRLGRAMEEVQIHEELKKFTSILEGVFEGTESIIYLKDRDACYQMVNTAYSSLLGLSRKGIIGKTDSEILSSNFSKKLEKDDRFVIKENKSELFEEIFPKENKDMYFLIRKTPLHNEQGDIIGLIGIGNDITHIKMAEKEKEILRKKMVESAKLASIGELSAGIGHEINNPLAIISGNMEMIKNHLKDEDKEDKWSDTFLKAQEVSIKRIYDIVNGLRTYARSDTDTIEKVPINNSIMRTISFLHILMVKTGINIETDLYQEELHFVGNSGKFQQVLINLINNAKDSLEGSSNPIIKITTHKTEKHAIIKVMDNGKGIRKKHLNRVFDSFFTTKETGRGTGLGLSIAKNIIENVGGDIEIDSKYGSGCTFKIVLPRVNAKDADDKAEKPLEEMRPLNGKILLVDDEEGIRDYLRMMFLEWGLTVDDAENGQEALKLIQENEYDVLITDLAMPIVSGEELIYLIRSDDRYADLKIFVITGIISEEFQRLPINDTIVKPFKNEKIYKALSEFLTPKD